MPGQWRTRFSNLRRSRRPPGRLSDGADSGGDSPWSAEHETELLRDAQAQLILWRTRARDAEKQLVSLKAATAGREGAVRHLNDTEGDMYNEAKVCTACCAAGTCPKTSCPAARRTSTGAYLRWVKKWAEHSNRKAELMHVGVMLSLQAAVELTEQRAECVLQ